MAASPEVKAMFRALQALPENKVCADCSSRIPQWASCSYGTYICLECSGIHRSLGQCCSLSRCLAAAVLAASAAAASVCRPSPHLCLSVCLTLSLSLSLSLSLPPSLPLARALSVCVV